jgi:hypothetical protein
MPLGVLVNLDCAHNAAATIEQEAQGPGKGRSSSTVRSLELGTARLNSIRLFAAVDETGTA